MSSSTVLNDTEHTLQYSTDHAPPPEIRNFVTSKERRLRVYARLRARLRARPRALTTDTTDHERARHESERPPRRARAPPARPPARLRPLSGAVAGAHGNVASI